MELQAIFICCLADEVLTSLRFQDDPQCKMSSAEIITFVVISSLHYQCNYRKTRIVVQFLKYFPKILSLSQLVRRIHQIPEQAWVIIFQMCQQILGARNYNEFIVDSFPVPCCQNNKILRCRLFQDKAYHGYTASKKAFFFGIKVHMIVNLQGIPIEFHFTPGGESDIRGFKRFEFDLQEGSRIYADRAYTDYLHEDLLKETCGIELIAKRKNNSKRQHSFIDEFFLSVKRNKIETAFSAIINLMPRCIRATTQKGFCMKIFFFILSYTIMRAAPITV